MDSYTENLFDNQQQQSQQHNSGLLRFRSAPSSLLSNFRGHNLDKGYNGNHDQSPGLVAGIGRGGGGGGGVGGCGDDSFESVESKPVRILQNGYSDSGELIIGQGQLPPQYTKHGGGDGGAAAVDGSVGTQLQPMKGKVVGDSNLAGQISPPPGFFAHLSAQNGYPTMTGSGEFIIGGGGPNEESSPPRPSRLKGQIDFKSSGLPSSMTRLPRIPEIGNENAKETSPDGGKFGSGDEHAPRFYNLGFSFSWDDSGSLVENGSEVRGDGHNDGMLYSGSDSSFSQNGSRPHLLSHHLSLPKSSAEMAAFEKMLHFQDTVPCKIRAKRGCATHPRSIAERMRRTRISDRMKRLQELVPNMEKQMNTADMLDLAVDYIKDLQEEYKKLSATRAKCLCSNGQKSAVN
ncbi:hypothetical protein Dimus_001945 [Dionaea muscipula]